MLSSVMRRSMLVSAPHLRRLQSTVASPTVGQRIYKFMWSDVVVYPATLGFGAWFAHYVYHYEQAGYTPTPSDHYSNKVAAATAAATANTEREQRRKLLRRISTLNGAVQAGAASELKRTLSMDKKDLEAALKALSKVKGGSEAIKELEKMKEEKVNFTERVADRLADAVGVQKINFNEWSGSRDSVQVMAGKPSLRWWM